jgi:hypothetical protein
MYREHPVWGMLEHRIQTLSAAVYQRPDLESKRREVVDVLAWAGRSAKNPVPVVYTQTLDELQVALNPLGAEENQFRTFLNSGYWEQVKNLVRMLPGPPPRQITDTVISTLDNAVAIRTEELESLRAEARTLRKEIQSLSETLKQQRGAVDRQNEKITAASATITQVVNTAEERLEADWTNRVNAWELERAAKDQEADRELFDRLQLLAGSAAVGRRLVEQAAGSLTATDWAARAKRERTNAMWLRVAAFAFFLGAVAVGAWVLAGAIQAGFELTIGDGIVRGALILAVAGVGTLLSAESRRHFKEADSAEEVQLAFTAIEPFYADAPEKERAVVRIALGDTVFVKNVLSRFASRDASKHTSATNADLTEVIELLTKSTDLARKINTPGQTP